MVVLDSSILMLVMNPTAKAPLDKSRKPIGYAQERVEHLLQTLDKGQESIIVPAPALAEVLAGAGDAAAAYAEIIGKSRHLRVAPFDLRASIESAILFGVSARKQSKRGSAKGAWQKIKVDQQIVAIAALRKNATVYTCDDGVAALCGDVGVDVIRLEDMPVPKDAMQVEMELREAEASGGAEGDG